jgi:excisionase family DNA binding protein
MDEADLSQPLFITVPAAARRLGISRSLAYELANRWLAGDTEGGLPAIRLGRRLLVSRSALESIANLMSQRT